MRARTMPLPPNGHFQIGTIYWRHVQRWGEYRPDMLEEEQRLYFLERGIDLDDESLDG